MTTYLVRRVLLSVPTVFGVATLIFLLVHLLPGDPARVIAGVNATPADVERIRHQLGLDQPGWQQYLTFLGRLAHGDLGTSTHTLNPVTSEIAARALYTAELAALSIVIAIAVGVAAGVVAATRRNTAMDLLISSAAIAGVSIPVYWLGLMLVVLFAIDLRVLPAAGAGGPTSIVLPAITLAFFSVGFIARQTRSAMLEVLGQDFVRTARAKGAGERRVLLRHALRNALLPVVTTIGLQFGTLLGGAVLTETVFAWPGIGRLLVDSIFFRDFPVVQGVVLLIAVAFIVVNLITDLVYAVVDPRIRYG
ncbi:MAG: ABC transporter permease [Candidatus Dormibacteraeota bacterium]|nr:ABC transporter permease [Candidatus Dormibacteraeota bacterium]